MPFLMIKEVYKWYNQVSWELGKRCRWNKNGRMLTVVEARWWVHEVSWFYFAYFVFCLKFSVIKLKKQRMKQWKNERKKVVIINPSWYPHLRILFSLLHTHTHTHTHTQVTRTTYSYTLKCLTSGGRIWEIFTFFLFFCTFKIYNYEYAFLL